MRCFFMVRLYDAATSSGTLRKPWDAPTYSKKVFIDALNRVTEFVLTIGFNDGEYRINRKAHLKGFKRLRSLIDA